MTCPVGRDVELAGQLLREGRLVAFGTETVYGLGADAFDPAAVARVFEVKGRPRFDPLIVHLADAAEVGRVAAELPPAGRTLADRFWPGPLTLVLPKLAAVPDLVTAGRATVAVRVPASDLARRLIAAAGVPVAAPSANPFGRISPTTAAHVVAQLGDAIDYILDGGPCAVGVESTVIDVTGPTPTLLRPGGLTIEEIEAVVGPLGISTEEVGPQRGPGMLSRHYAPTTPLTLADRPTPRGPNDGLLAFAETDGTGFARVETLSPAGDLREAAANLFAALRRLDAAGLDRVFAMPAPDVGLGRAINDRLRRAAARK